MCILRLTLPKRCKIPRSYCTVPWDYFTNATILQNSCGIFDDHMQKFVRFNTMCVWVCSRTVNFARSEKSALSWKLKNNILVLRFKHPFMIVSHAMTPINWTLVIENLDWITCLLNLRRLGILHYSNFVTSKQWTQS